MVASQQHVPCIPMGAWEKANFFRKQTYHRVFLVKLLFYLCSMHRYSLMYIGDPLVRQASVLQVTEVGPYSPPNHLYPKTFWYKHVTTYYVSVHDNTLSSNPITREDPDQFNPENHLVPGRQQWRFCSPKRPGHYLQCTANGRTIHLLRNR